MDHLCHQRQARSTSAACEQWTFDQSLTHVFGDMLWRSIPQYDVHGFGVALNLVQPGTACGRCGLRAWRALAWFLDVYAGDNRYVRIDSSLPMISAARHRFTPELERSRLFPRDLREAYPTDLSDPNSEPDSLREARITSAEIQASEES